ncbi:uncharacterized protein VICG_01149 [Vittaforma corneae ATCC 50505]|uniref:Inorganic phosphate transporter n=1 Tax=Vittaforma corneae (strain ATCC 50505) TaxID=993615 RepID=L2GNA5_VITCO|nr:uncharacterized protein VICG_01149 [Vittaforma corneae ATCC 50505]ELA41797.1 hypothetical protein VICG_01149 [Vittaforma corneae ATCC 50505]
MEITLPAAEQFLGIIFTLAVVQMIKKPFMSDPLVVKAIRIAFFVSAVIQLLIAYYIKRKIGKTNSQKKFKYKPEASLLNVSENPDQEIEITYSEYDSNEATKMLRSIAFQTVLYTALAFKFKNTQPMLLQTLNLLKNMFLSPLYRAYLYGMEVERPFERNLLFSFKKQEPMPAPTSTADRKKKKEE